MIDPLILVRGTHFAATLLVAGTVCFTVLVAAPSRRLTQMVWGALVVTVLSGAVWLALIAAHILEMPFGAIAAQDLWTVLSGIRFGLVACLRLGCAISLGLLLAAPAFPGRRALQLAAAAGLAGLLALVGHAGATPGAMGWLHLTSDLIHVLAAAAWLGGLPALALTLSAPTATTITVRFSVLGIVCVGALLASGAVNSWQLLNGPGDLLTTAYGRLLAIKIGLFAVMVGIATINRYCLTPRLPSPQAIKALRRNTMLETGAGIALLMMAGALGTMIPGGHVHTLTAQPQSEAAFVHIHTEVVMADVTIDPGRAGNSNATIRLSREDSSEYPASDVKLTIAPRDIGASLLERAATQTADGTWLIENIDIPSAGVWTLRLKIGAAGAPAVLLDAPIVITQ